MAMSAGEIAQTAMTAAASGRGHRSISQAAAIAAAIHMIWKYLFMSNTTALTTTRLGTRKRASVQPGEKPTTRRQTVAAPGPYEGQDRQDDRDAEVISKRTRRPVDSARFNPLLASGRE